MNTPLQQSVWAVIARWESPAWKDMPHTGEYIDAMRKALADEQAQAVEPVSAKHRTTGWVSPVDRYAVPVLFNPYTGNPRDVRDVQSDPQGVLIVPPGKVEMLAAKPTVESVTDCMMNLVDRLGHEASDVDARAWEHLLVYAPKKAQAVEPVAVVLNGHYQQRAHLDDGIVHNLYLHPAPPAKQAQAVEKPVAYWIPKAEQFCLPDLNGQRPFAKAWEPLFTRPAVTGERAELIAKYRRLVHAARLRGQSFTPAITKGELLALCDMLEADAKFKPDWVGYRQGVEDGKAEAQQVAVPVPVPVPMTHEQINELMYLTDGKWADADVPMHWARHFARAIEAHHGIGAKK